MSEVIFREVFKVKTYMNFYEETNTYESKPSTLNIYEIENGQRKNFVGKANLDFSDYISKIDHQVTPENILMPLTLKIF